MDYVLGLYMCLFLCLFDVRVAYTQEITADTDAGSWPIKFSPFSWLLWDSIHYDTKYVSNVLYEVTNAHHM